MRLTFRQAAVLTPILFLASVGAFFYFFVLLTYAYKVDSATANATLCQDFSLPTAAHDVSLMTSVRYSKVEFSIEEQDFVNWCRSHGWEIVELDPDHPVVFDPILSQVERSRRPVEERVWWVENGLVFQESPNDGGYIRYSGVFDRVKKRADAVYFPRPNPSTGPPPRSEIRVLHQSGEKTP